MMTQTHLPRKKNRTYIILEGHKLTPSTFFFLFFSLHDNDASSLPLSLSLSLYAIRC